MEPGAASEVGDDATVAHRLTQQRGAVEEPSFAGVAPLGSPRFVHRHGVAIHRRSIAW